MPIGLRADRSGLGLGTQHYLDVVDGGRLQTPDRSPNAATGFHDEHDAGLDLILAERDDLTGAAFARAGGNSVTAGRQMLV